MTNLKDKLKNSWNWIKENPKKTILGLGLAGLIAVSTKDNVHFGSVTLNDPQENHYAWGIIPQLTIQGKANGNMNVYGLFGINKLKENSEITGSMNAYGIFGINELRKNSEITGNMNAYGLILMINGLEDNSQITGDISNKGLFVYNDIEGFSLGSNDVKGLKNYVIKDGEKIK